MPHDPAGTLQEIAGSWTKRMSRSPGAAGVGTALLGPGRAQSSRGRPNTGTLPNSGRAYDPHGEQYWSG